MLSRRISGWIALVLSGALLIPASTANAQQRGGSPPAAAPDGALPTPADVPPGSITYEDVPYPHPVQYVRFTTYGQDVRMAFMDVPPTAPPNGRTVLLLHGMNFAGFYWGGPIDVLRKEGFRVLDHLKIVGHVPHFETPEKFYPPLLAFLKEGLTATGTSAAAR